MSELTDLYQEVILDHNRRPRNFRALEQPSRTQEGYNPLCGDRLTVYVKLAGDVIEEVVVPGTGCAISKASASLMTDALKGKTVGQARDDVRSVSRYGHVPSRDTGGGSRQVVRARRCPRVPHPHQMREPGVAHAEGRCVGRHSGTD